MASLNELIALLRDVVDQVRESAVKAAGARDRVEAESEQMRGVLEGHSSELPGDALEAVARNPSRTSLRDKGVWIARGTHHGVDVVAVVRPDGSIAAGWPERGPGVSRNTR